MGDSGVRVTLWCCLRSKLFGKKLDPHEEAMQILKEQLSAAQVPAAMVGTGPPPGPPVLWGCPQP